jgi:hypothetical protein
MTLEQYDAKRAEITQTYGETSKEANAKREQALAMLFVEFVAGRDERQRPLAEREGKSQKWVDYRLRFGRFLTLRTTGSHNTDGLTERRFRGFWAMTEGSPEDEPIRFREVARLMVEEPTAQPEIWPTMRDHYSDGRWHDCQVVADHLGVDVTLVEKNCRENGTRRNKGKQEIRHTGSKRRGDWRMQFRAHKRALKPIETSEIRHKMLPILKRLGEEGHLSDAAISTARVLGIFNELMHLVKEWTQPPE